MIHTVQDAETACLCSIMTFTCSQRPSAWRAHMHTHTHTRTDTPTPASPAIFQAAGSFSGFTFLCPLPVFFWEILLLTCFSFCFTLAPQLTLVFPSLVKVFSQYSVGHVTVWCVIFLEGSSKAFQNSPFITA